MSKAEVACLIVALIVVASRFAGAGRVARPPVHIAHARSRTIVRSSDTTIDPSTPNRLEKKTNTISAR
jgi:hypothetical protein